MRLLRILALIAAYFLLEVAVCSATTRYVAQSAGTFSGGTACNGQTAITPTTWNSTSLSAGDITYICGALTASSGTILSNTSSGSSGNPIVVIFDSSARISVGFGQIINLHSDAYWLFNGGFACGPGTACDAIEAANMTGYAAGQTGIVEATANGSGLANQNTSTQAFYGCSNCHDIEIKNLIIRNLYIHSSTSDTTSSADTGNFIFQCAFSAHCSGVISIHDNSIHDTGNAISIQGPGGSSGSVSTTFNIYNNDMYRNNWELDYSGNGQRTVYIHDNHWHDALNWDTTADAFHHNGIHNFNNVSSDSLGYFVYNNISDGNWGACCSTAISMFTEIAHPDNLYYFNNVAIQSCSTNTAPPLQDYTTPSGPEAAVYNNTFMGCATTSGNTWALQLYGTGITAQNNAVQGWGQYITVGTGFSITSIDYNSYGSSGLSGNSPFQCGGSGVSTFASWKSSACSPDAHGQKVTNINVNATTGQPNSGSPLIGAATNLFSTCNGQPNPGLGALCFDAAGVARPSSGNWDAGAYQFAASPVSPLLLIAKQYIKGVQVSW